ncbi:MAG: exo-alpha-sialidase [Gammaproteobacteria bacterium]|nr:exo-alpha-sialidase [Gammaproteobacteria bacterium]
MKAAAALLPALVLASCGGPVAPSPDEPWFGSGSPTHTATYPGMQWQRVLDAAPWGERAMPHGGWMDGYFYVLTGRAGMFTIYGDTWRSADGVNWERMSDDPGWGKRAYPSVELVQGNIVLIAGQSLATFYNDVWRSADEGRTWDVVTRDAPWDVRAGHHTAVIGDDIYLYAGARNSFGRVFYPELWVSSDQGATWELRTNLPEDMGRAGMQVVEIDGTIYFMGGDHDNPVFVANWPGRRNDVWKSDDKGKTWTLLGNAPWVPRTGHQCAAYAKKVYCIGGHVRGPEKETAQYLAHDLWVWDPKASSERMDGWQLITNTAWDCPDTPDSCGKSDFLLVIRDGRLWTLGGDREVAAPWPQDNDVWVAKLPR